MSEKAITLSVEQAQEILKADRIITGLCDILNCTDEDIPPAAVTLILHDVQDGLNWIAGEVHSQIEKAEESPEKGGQE